MNIREICDMEPIILANTLASKYCVDIPTDINDYVAMTKAGSMLGQLTNSYSYLISILTVMKVIVRQTKRNGTKEDYETMVARRDVIQDITDLVKQQYQAISRMITVKQEINKEMQML